MEKIPLVSVIIPVYNVSSYLCECLDSVISQSYTYLDIILIDDGSTDGSDQICDLYQKNDKRIRVIHQENRGLSGARNAGLDIVRGSVVAFLDSDDAYLPQMIELMVKNMIENNADIVICDYYICRSETNMQVSESRNKVNLKKKMFNAQTTLELMAENKCDFYVWNKIYKRFLFDHLRFPQGHVYEDIIIMPQIISRAKRVLQIDLALIIYRKRLGSISASYNESNIIDWLYARKKAEKVFIKNDELPLDSKCYFLEMTFQHLIRNYLILIAYKNISNNTKVVIENELSTRAKRMQCFSLKTRVYYCLYRFDPILLIFIRNIFCNIKKAINTALKPFK